MKNTIHLYCDVYKIISEIQIKQQMQIIGSLRNPTTNESLDKNSNYYDIFNHAFCMAGQLEPIKKFIDSSHFFLIETLRLDSDYYFGIYKYINTKDENLSKLVDLKTLQPVENSNTGTMFYTYVLYSFKWNIFCMIKNKPAAHIKDAYQNYLSEVSGRKVKLVPYIIRDWKEYVNTFFSEISELEFFFADINKAKSYFPPLHNGLNTIDSFITKCSYKLKVKAEKSLIIDSVNQIIESENDDEYAKVQLSVIKPNKQSQIIDIINSDIVFQIDLSIDKDSLNNIEDNHRLMFLEMKKGLDEAIKTLYPD